MTPVPLNVFITGATGLIAGEVISRLLEHPKFQTFRITGLVRSPEKAQKLESIGISTIIGNYSELEKLEDCASKADVVFTFVDCDDERANDAILKGLKKRFEMTDKAPILIHTSGTAVFNDNAMGMYASDKIYSDADVAQIELIPVTSYHRPVDLAIVAADKAGYVKTHIVLPSYVYGVGKGRLLDLGIQHPHSIILPFLINFALERGSSFIVGEGKNVCANVEVGDLADLYLLLFNAIIEEKNPAHGREGFYNGASGEHSQYEGSKAVATVLFRMGLLKSDEPTPLTEAEIKQVELAPIVAGNSRVSSDRSRALGWKPTKTSADFLAGVEPAVAALGLAPAV